MTGPTELLVLRLALIGVIFLFVAVMALSMRGGLTTRERRSAPAQRSQRWRLVVLSPGDTGIARGAQFELAGTMVIGRDGRAGISLPDASVSTRHASIERASSGWKLIDLDSTNGTFVNGRQLDGSGVVLRGREKVAFGNVVVQLSDG